MTMVGCFDTKPLVAPQHTSAADWLMQFTGRGLQGDWHCILQHLKPHPFLHDWISLELST